MEEKLSKKLTWFYYGCYVLACLVATAMWYMVSRGYMQPIPPQSAQGNVIQYIAIIYTIVSVPGGLYAFKLICNKIKRLESSEKYATYYKWAVVRICVIGIGITLDVAAFYLLSGYKSMLWCGAISAVGLFFCKPMPRKIELELTDEEQK